MPKNKPQTFESIAVSRIRIYLRRVSYSVGWTNNSYMLSALLVKDKEMEPVLRDRIRDEMNRKRLEGRKKDKVDTGKGNPLRLSEREEEAEKKIILKDVKRELMRLVKR